MARRRPSFAGGQLFLCCHTAISFNSFRCQNCLQLEDKSNNAAYTLRQVYQKHLLAFEEYDRDREDNVDASLGPPTHAGAKPSKRSSEPRDDAEEAADILNAIMGLSSFPQEQALPKKRAKSVGVVRTSALVFRCVGTFLGPSSSTI